MVKVSVCKALSVLLRMKCEGKTLLWQREKPYYGRGKNPIDRIFTLHHYGRYYKILIEVQYMDKEQYKQIELNKERTELVVKSNEIIRNIRYSLSATEMKILAYVISKIVAEDKELKKVRFRLYDYMEVAGLTKIGGSDYRRLKKSIQELRDKSWWIKEGNTETLFAWFDTAKIDKNTKEVELTLSESLTPYLVQLKSNFSKYELINVLCLKSKYSIRLYEIFKSYLWLGKWEVKVEDLRTLINMSDRYKDFTEFKRNILNPSIKEINKYTDLTVELTDTIKSGRSIDLLKFSIIEKKGVQLTLDLLLEQDKRLNG